MSLPKKKTGKIAMKALGLPLKLQFMLIYGLLLGMLTAFSCLLINAEINDANQHQADTIGELLSSQTASAAGNMLVTGDRLSLSVLLNQLVQNPYIAEASIYSIDNRRMGYAAGKNMTGAQQSEPVYSAPINYQDVIAGYVRLSLNQQLLTQKPREAINIIISVSAILLITGLVFLFFYGDKLARKLSLIERQLHSILPFQTTTPDSSNEIDRIATLAEHQLTEKYKNQDEDESDQTAEEMVAIVSIRAKNLSRLQQLLAPQDLMDIIRLQMDIASEAASLYEGKLSYSPEGNGYIRFSSLDSENFAMDALCCGLLIEKLSQRTTEQSIAKIQTGIGLCLSDQVAEFPEENHPALEDSAASQALMLASLPDPDGLHMLRKQLSWLPADITEIEVSDHGDDIIFISDISEPEADEVEKQAKALEASLMG